MSKATPLVEQISGDAMRQIRAEQARTQNIGDYGPLEAIIQASIERAIAAYVISITSDDANAPLESPAAQPQRSESEIEELTNELVMGVDRYLSNGVPDYYIMSDEEKLGLRVSVFKPWLKRHEVKPASGAASGEIEFIDEIDERRSEMQTGKRILECSASGTPTACSPGAVEGSEQPTWACSKWGGYEHDWMECPECLEAYSKLNESIIEPPKEERGEPQRPRIHNLKMLDAIRNIVIEHSRNEDLANDVYSYLRAGVTQIATAGGTIIAEAAAPQPRKALPRGERSDPKEWTPRYVQSICENGFADDLTPEQATVIADAHNEAITAERKKREQVDDFFRDPNGSFMVEGESTFARVRNYTQELDGRIDDLESQLLRAQAAIEKIKNIYRDWFENATAALDGTAPREHLSKSQWEAIRQTYAAVLAVIPDVDLSALERHDAEVRKPLAEAIKFFKSVIQSGESWTPTCQKAFDAALAQAKENRRDSAT